MSFPVLSQSITGCRMFSNEVQLSGKSMNWHYFAIKAAIKLHEECPHLDINQITIKMCPLTFEKIDSIRFDVSCNVCERKFSKTSDKLTSKFIKFYGL